jgi:hypothetical protein
MYPDIQNDTNGLFGGTVGEGPTGPTIGGVYSTIPAYANYWNRSESDEGTPDEFSWQWVMLTNDIGGNPAPPNTQSRWAQIGPMTGSFPWFYESLSTTYALDPGSGQTNDSAIMIQYTTSSGAVDTIDPEIQMVPGTKVSYKVLYNEEDYDFTFWYDSNGSWVNLHTQDLGWTATQAVEQGKTHSLQDQMYGDANDPEFFTNTFVYENGPVGDTWYSMDYEGQASFYNAGTNDPTAWTPDYTQNVEFGNDGSSAEDPEDLGIWDWACLPHEMAFQSNIGQLYVENTSSGLESTDLGLNVMSATSPSIATLNNGSYEIAYQQGTGGTGQCTDGDLAVFNCSTGTTCTAFGMNTAGYSPSVAALPGGGCVVAFEANTNDLYLWSCPSSCTTTNTSLGVAEGTNPSVTGVSGGGYDAAFSGAGTDDLVTYSSSSGPYNQGLKLEGDTSPSYTTLSNGTTYVVSSAGDAGPGDNDLDTYTSGVGSYYYGLQIANGSSPSIAALTFDDEFEMALVGDGTNHLDTYSSSSGGDDSGLSGASGMSPAIAGTALGAYWVNYRGDDGSLIQYSPYNGPYDTEQGMMSGTNSCIAP